MAAIIVVLFHGEHHFHYRGYASVSVFTLFPVGTMVLALAPSTRRWCESSP